MVQTGNLVCVNTLTIRAHFPLTVLWCDSVGGDLHSLGLDEIEDVALGGCSDVEPGAGQQVAQGAASREVRAPPDVQPPTQHLEHTDRAQNICERFSTFGQTCCVVCTVSQ